MKAIKRKAQFKFLEIKTTTSAVKHTFDGINRYYIRKN